MEEYEITVDGVTDTATYEEGCFIIEFDGQEISGNIHQGVWTAEDPADQAIVDAFQEVYETENDVGPGNAPSTAEYEITVDGVTAVASYEDLGFKITFQDQVVYGKVTTGVWGASSGDEADQAIVDAFESVYVTANDMGH